jgi:hypothetical protein
MEKFLIGVGRKAADDKTTNSTSQESAADVSLRPNMSPEL